MPLHVSRDRPSRQTAGKYIQLMLSDNIAICPASASLFQDETRRDHVVLLDHLLYWTPKGFCPHIFQSVLGLSNNPLGLEVTSIFLKTELK